MSFMNNLSNFTRGNGKRIGGFALLGAAVYMLLSDKKDDEILDQENMDGYEEEEEIEEDSGKGD